ncbi:hypothetical protein CAOG_07194 [Capsaspora owczarzaki ATCC 30864]|nr:hypothetical protein CAOG_07194 [Capsaspora owczarzaki ATCC 30864]|eukprot:XP_004343918.1 hypothetical protein CAOG_07194 [Capsaspora owczarzaki ATCC 30864]
MLALPPPDRLASVGPALQDYRFVRQDTELWKALHHGVVTSSGIATMAGLRERQAVGLLGLAKHYVKHDAIREIVQSLREARLHDSDLHHQQEDAIAVALRAMHLSGSPKNPQASPTNDHVLTAYNSPSTKELGSKIHVGESLPHRPVASALSEFPDATAARLRWGSAQEPSSVLSLLDIFPAPNYRVAECGMFLLDWDAEGVTSRMNQLGFTRDMLPPLGASPDGLLFHRPVTEHHANNADCVVDPDTAKYVPFDVSLATMSPRAEILEIKNTCPFVEAKGQGKHKFRWLAMQPQEQIASMNIPQLQLQMFVANVQSALYISVSATRGLNIFRVMRDDEYVRLLLRLVHFTYKHCVVDGNEPVEDLHAGRPELRQLVQRTLAISRSTPILEHVSGSHVQRIPDNSATFLS